VTRCVVRLLLVKWKKTLRWVRPPERRTAGGTKVDCHRGAHAKHFGPDFKDLRPQVHNPTVGKKRVTSHLPDIFGQSFWETEKLGNRRSWVVPRKSLLVCDVCPPNIWGLER